MRFNNRAMALAGIPDLPIEAFKHDGDRKIKPQGGDSPPPPPSNTSSNVTQTTIPEYARPYVERLLGKSEAYSESPYQAYGGERIAGFSPLQQQAFEGAANLGPAEQLGTATRMAGYAGLGSLGAGSQYAQQATNPYATQAYMSPYMQNALAPQLREAERQSDIMGQKNAAQAVGAGAFGGSRFGLQEAERQRNLGQQQSDIYGKGMQTAFEQARQAQQFGADLGLRGYGQALQGAGQLGQIGQQQYNQQLGAMQAQGMAGAQQQQLEQQKLTQQYQDYLTQRGDPQQKLAFMSDVLRGVPLSQQTQQQFTAAPSAASNIASLGLGAYGVSQLMKKEGGIVGLANGGMVSMASGGISSGVSPEKLQTMLRGMGDDKQGGTDQLATIEANANDALTLALVQEERRRRELIRMGEMLGKPQSDTTVKEDMLAQALGIEGIPVPDAMFADTAVGEQPEQAPQQEMARGGIVAFKNAGAVKAPAALSPSQQLAAFDPSAAMMDTGDEFAKEQEAALARRAKFLGPDTVSPILAEMQKNANPALTDEDKAQRNAAMAFEAAQAFQAAGPGQVAPTFLQGFAGAGKAVTNRLAEYKKLDKDAKKAELAIKLDSAKLERAEKKENFALSEEITQKLAAQKAKLAEIKLQQAHFVAQDAREGQKIAVQSEANKIGKVTDFRDLKASYLNNLIQKHVAKNGQPPDKVTMAEFEATAGTMAADRLRQFAAQRGGDELEVKKAKEGREKLDDYRSTRAYRDRIKAAKNKPGGADAEEKRIMTEFGVGGGGGNVIQWESIGGAK